MIAQGNALGKPRPDPAPRRGATPSHLEAEATGRVARDRSDIFPNRQRHQEGSLLPEPCDSLLHSPSIRGTHGSTECITLLHLDERTGYLAALADRRTFPGIPSGK